MIKFIQDSYKPELCKFYTGMLKICAYWQDRIYACIFQIIWQYKRNFHKTIQGISKSLLFLFNFIPWIDFYKSIQKFSESA